MRVGKLAFVSVLVFFCAYGCGEEERSPLEVVSRTKRITVPGMVLIPAREFQMGDTFG